MQGLDVKYKYSTAQFNKATVNKRNISVIKIDILEETPFRALNGPSIFYRTHAAPTHASAASASNV